MLLLSSADFFKKHSGILSACLTAFRTDRMLFLIWVQTVCKGYLQMAKFAASKVRVKYLHSIPFSIQKWTNGYSTVHHFSSLTPVINKRILITSYLNLYMYQRILGT